jgi:glycosyltransferase involved in cell wall biosynthesis
MMTSEKQLDQNGNLILGIDATNLRSGGGFNHLVQLFTACPLKPPGVLKVILWGNPKIAAALPQYEWLDIKKPIAATKSIFFRIFWQQVVLPRELKKNKCHILFSPGGSAPLLPGTPTMVMSQNMLPFEEVEYKRYPWLSYQRFRLFLLRRSQTRSFLNANGLVFLSTYARTVISLIPGIAAKECRVIPHGVDGRFFYELRGVEDLSLKPEIRIIYPSTVDMYKHQWIVAKAVSRLRQETRLNISVSFAGGNYPRALKKLQRTLDLIDPDRTFCHELGELDFQSLHKVYKSFDLMVYASSCENLPNIIMEAMASGIPMAASNRGPMPELLGKSAVFFDPTNEVEIAHSLRTLIFDAALRNSNARICQDRVREFSWAKSAQETFSFAVSLASK